MSTDDPTGREDAEIGAVARAEAQRRRRGLILLVLSLAVAGAVITGFWALAEHEGGMGPQLDVASEEQSKVEETDDPQCRTLIARVTALGKQYKKEVPQLEAVLSEDPTEVKRARAAVAAWREELERLRVESREANLRFENSPKELAEWFDFVDTELRLLDLRGERQLARLEAQARGEEYVPLEGKSKKKRGKIVGKKEDERTPLEKRDASILAIHDAFEKFRVWHTGGMHPCGDNAEDEQPWTPGSAEPVTVEPIAAPAAAKIEAPAAQGDMGQSDSGSAGAQEAPGAEDAAPKQ